MVWSASGPVVLENYVILSRASLHGCTHVQKILINFKSKIFSFDEGWKWILLNWTHFFYFSGRPNLRIILAETAIILFGLLNSLLKSKAELHHTLYNVFPLILHHHYSLFPLQVTFLEAQPCLTVRQSVGNMGKMGEENVRVNHIGVGGANILFPLTEPKKGIKRNKST